MRIGGENKMTPQPICSIIGCIDRIETVECEYEKEEKYYKSHILRMQIRQAIQDGYTVFACSGDNQYNVQGLLILLQELCEDKYKSIVVNPIYGKKGRVQSNVWTQLDALSMVSVHIGTGYEDDAILAREQWLRDHGDRIIEIM